MPPSPGAGATTTLIFAPFARICASMPDVRSTDRQNRLRAALRENLKRRKQQAKGRVGGPADEPAVRAGEEQAGREEDEAKPSD